MPLVNENEAQGIAGRNQTAGRLNYDSALPEAEEGFRLPWSNDPETTWMYYECAIGVMLDSGIVVHNRLPQVDHEADTLGVGALDDPNLDRLTGFGVNLRCNDQYTDIKQRMGHARYWFRLWGQALRVGFQVPIPKITQIGGVEAVPYDRNLQWAYNQIVPGGNYAGIALWHARWSLWYTTVEAPVENVDPRLHVDLVTKITGATELPADIQAPFSLPDDDAERPVGRLGDFLPILGDGSQE